MKIINFKYLCIYLLFSLITFSACKESEPVKLLYQGHSGFRIITGNGIVIYIDPFDDEGYDLPADIILVTHEHLDHNKVDIIPQKNNCVVIRNNEAQKGGKYNVFSVKKGVRIEAVEASNRSHPRSIGVGYIITIDGIKLYHAGDTSRTEQMETFPEKSIDYAILPCDGIYNMNTMQAAECAEIIKARFIIPMHTGPFSNNTPKSLFDKNIALQFNSPNRLILEPGEEIELGR